MTGKFVKSLGRGLLVFAIPFFCCHSVCAQQEKGSKEVQFFSSSFSFTADASETITRIVGNSEETRTRSRSQGFSLGGRLGYFLTRKHEVGGGTDMNIFRSRFCRRVVQNEQLIDEDCNSNTFFRLGLTGFYRYNFAGEGARGFPFVGGEFAVSDVTRNFTGNLSVRPHAGYKYYLKKNVALDFSLGYSAQLNKVTERDEFFSFETSRGSSVNGVFSLSFVW
ncbi:MAG: hypothetical protein L0229_08110 [Blastocatellia bacterium]|nr:hypothetical protein [Blastocatellia bacterium]